jgi:hypothetical protein
MEGWSREEILNKLKKMAIAGLISAATLGYITKQYQLSKNEVAEIENVMPQEKEEKQSEWELLSTGFTGTVYNASENQTDSTPNITATQFRINLGAPESHRILAIERTMLQKYGLKMGDVVRVEGTNSDLDGVWQLQDKMARKFQNQEKIDFLVANDRKLGKWNNLSLYKLKPGVDDFKYRSQFAPQATEG